MYICNTQFQKPQDRLCTYKEEKQAGWGPPFKRANYETLDYIIINDDFGKAIKELKRIIIAKKFNSVSLNKWVNSISDS